jgi:hypothetical protein
MQKTLETKKESRDVRVAFMSLHNKKFGSARRTLFLGNKDVKAPKGETLSKWNKAD